MRRALLVIIAAIFVFGASAVALAQAEIQSQPFGGKLKIEGYAEYINFHSSHIDHSTWGGGVLARYMFLDWLGAQTNVTFYSDCSTSKLPSELGLLNWRLSAILQAHLTDIAPELYLYGGAGIGVQFNDNVGSVDVDNAFLGHVLGGLGWEFYENFFVEGELGYQFGDADTSNYTSSDISMDALFVRLGVGFKI